MSWTSYHILPAIFESEEVAFFVQIPEDQKTMSNIKKKHIFQSGFASGSVVIIILIGCLCLNGAEASGT